MIKYNKFVRKAKEERALELGKEDMITLNGHNTINTCLGGSIRVGPHVSATLSFFLFITIFFN